MQLRYYQRESVDGLFEWFSTNPEGNPLVAIPGGCGKSLIIAEFVRQALTLWPSTRIIIASHVKELVEQDLQELLTLWRTAPCGVYSAGLGRRDTHFPITFAGIASIAKRIGEFGHIDLLLVDEAHLISHKEATTYQKAIAALKVINPAVRVIGFTATPYRAGLGYLTEGDIFTAISTNYCTLNKFNQLLDDGFICPLVPKKTDYEVSADGVHIRGGEYVQAELQEAVDKDSVTRAALTEAVQRAHDREHWLCFATGIKHADHIRDILLELGVSAVCVHSQLEGNLRDENIKKFKAGQVRAMVGINIFSTGFNYRPTDCLVILRPTLSAVWWVQALSRGTRLSPETGKTSCLVLDFARNTSKLGCLNDPVIPRKPGKKGSGIVPFKVCPQCATYMHVRVTVCPDCFFKMPIPVKIAQKASELELIRRDPPPLPKPKKERPPPPLPELETYRVNRIEFAKHRPRDPLKAESLKVSYICGVRIIPEYLCFGHPKGLPKHKANSAWREMAKTDPPATVDEALARSGELRAPVQIRVLSGKYDEVVGRDFN